MTKRLRKNPPKRADGQTTMSVSLSVSLKQELTALAHADERSLSNYLVIRLSELVKRSKAAKEALA